MQKKHESILRAINNSSGKYNILTFPVHEAYQTGLGRLPHTFYLAQRPGTTKPWNFKFRPLPQNHILLDGTDNQFKNGISWDIVLSQNKFGNFQVAQPIARQTGVPLVSIEHTLPVPTWTTKHKKALTQLRGDLNLFISEYSIRQWEFDPNDPSVRVIEHGIDTAVFKPLDKDGHNDGKILSVVNDWIQRDWCCNFSGYKRICLDNNLPVNPIGDTADFSLPAKGVKGLVSKYQNASVFINTSTISPVPTALLEAMSCGCPVVTTATCQIPSIVQNGINGWISNDESYLLDRLQWCLKHPEDAKQMGKNARKTILERFSLEVHLQKWNDVFKEVYGRVYSN